MSSSLIPELVVDSSTNRAGFPTKSAGKVSQVGQGRIKFLREFPHMALTSSLNRYILYALYFLSFTWIVLRESNAKTEGP
jgi:hypothetical protein